MDVRALVRLSTTSTMGGRNSESGRGSGENMQAPGPDRAARNPLHDEGVVRLSGTLQTERPDGRCARSGLALAAPGADEGLVAQGQRVRTGEDVARLFADEGPGNGPLLEG